MTFSPEYRAQLVEMHRADGKSWGTKGFRHADEVLQFSVGCRSILDYGSGKGTLREALRGVDVRNYDPGIPGNDLPPEPADMVTCTDVLEHIEPEYLNEVLKHIFTLAQQKVYLHIALLPAKQFLPDGRNAHLIVQPADWWLTRLRDVEGWMIVCSQLGRKHLTVWLQRT